MRYVTEADIRAAATTPYGIVSDVCAEVAEITGVAVAKMRGQRGSATTCRARDMVVFIARRQGVSWPVIAEFLGRDHSTVAASWRRERARRAE